MNAPDASSPAEGAESGSIFRWDTLRAVSRDDFLYESRLVPGKMYEVELASGPKVRVWRSEDGREYFCHGLTFGGKGAPGGAISPYTGEPVETILREYYALIPEAEARAGDILVWKGIAPDTTPHSAVLTDPVVVPGTAYLADAAMLRSKNGLKVEAGMTLEDLIRRYGESYITYRRR